MPLKTGQGYRVTGYWVRLTAVYVLFYPNKMPILPNNLHRIFTQ